MSKAGFWGVDSDTGEDIYILYEDLEADVRKEVIKPLGGFIFPAGAFTELTLPEVPFYVKDLLPRRGKAMLYAPPKTGKSFLCLQLARCIGSGEPFLGLPVAKGRVLYVQLELGEEILQSRILSTKHEYEDVFLGTTFTMKLDSTAGQEMLWRAMEAIEPNVLILDPWYKCLSGDEDKKVDVMPILDKLDDLIEAYNCALFLIHHSGKDTTKRGRGSSVLEDWVDSYISMSRTSHEAENLKVRIKPVFMRHAPLWEKAIEAEFKDFEFVPVAGALTVKQQVEKFINENDKVEVKDIFAAKVGSNTSIYSALKELVKDGKIVKLDWGKYGKVEL